MTAGAPRTTTISDAALPLDRRSPGTSTASLARTALPGMLVVAGSVIGLVSAQGGYFPTSWGLSATLLLWTIGLWLIVSARTDAGRFDLVFLGLLALFTCWIGLSILWSTVPAQSVLELERTLVLLAGTTAVLVLARQGHAPKLTGVLLAVISLVSTYSLATRLFPDRLGQYDSIATYRLSDPLGYWNSLGIFAVMGLLLALGVVVDAAAKWARAAAAASVVVLAATLYFTFSRGSWLALGIGFCVLVAVTPRRLRTIATAVVIGAPAALGVLLGSSSYALTHERVALARASSDGHRLALVIVALAAVGAVLPLLLELAERRFAVPRGMRLAIGGALAVSVVLALSSLVVREGGPVTMARNAWHAFSAPPPEFEGDLDKRLFSFSGNGRVALWRVARDLYVDNPVTGSGAGTFERFWQARDDVSFKVRDAHSLYVETLAELGPFGLTLLVATLLVPLGAGLTVRRAAMLPAVLAAYAAFLVHTGVDWDWELSGVTLTALLVGCVGIVAARKGAVRTLGSSARIAGCAAVVVASLGGTVVFLGNGALDRAQEAVLARRFGTAVDEADRARRLMPWSPWPLIARGDAQLAAGDATAAAGSYRRAIAVDAGEWRAWFGLALATEGRARATALAHARRLYPGNDEVAATAATSKDEAKK
jgi:hypothetical protein